MVFDDRTDPPEDPLGPAERTVAQPMDFEALDPAEATDAHEAPELEGELDAHDPPTIIDQSLGDAVRALEPQVIDETDPQLDERLDNPPVVLDDDTDDFAAPPERTVRARSPFGVHVEPVLGEHADTLTEASLERTQRARVPYDLKAELTLPPSANRPKPRPSPVDPVVAPAPDRPAPKPRASTPADARARTSLDIAAALGMAPEPAPAEPKVSTPSPKLEPELRVPEKGGERKLDLGLEAPASKRGERGPREGLRSDQLAGLAESTSRISRLIPIALGLLVLLATIAVSLQLLPSRERQEHVELRFLAIGGAGEITARTSVETRLTIETTPPGLLVLFDRQVLGKTPFTAEVPVDFGEGVALELSSPYFERYLGEVRPDPSGAYRIQVDLTRRERR